MISNLDVVSSMARRIRLKQGVGSVQDELALCRVMLDLKFMTELVDALRVEIVSRDTELVSIRSTYERMLGERKDEIDSLTKDQHGRNV